MNDPVYSDDNDIDLFEIYEFLRDGWKTIFTTVFLSALVGLGALFYMPEKFLASANIEPAMVLGESVESADALAEKMQSPTFYAPQTFAACDLSQVADPAAALTKALKPNVPRNSSFVSVNYKSAKVDISTACLNAVLQDVNRNSDKIIKPRLELAKISDKAEKAQLKAAEDLVEKIANKVITFGISDSELLASQLLMTTQFSKQSEVVTLRSNIEKREVLLAAPNTRPAAFVTPIYAPAAAVSPSALVIGATSLFAGGFLGLLILFIKRGAKFIETRTKAKLSKA